MTKYQKTIIHAVGAISYAVSQWLVLTFAARFISLEAAGLYSYYLAILTPASILFSLGLRNSISSDLNSTTKYSSYLSAQLIGITGFTAFFITIAIIENSINNILIAVFLIKAIELSSELTYGDWVRRGIAQKYGVSKILRFILFIPIFIVSLQLFKEKEECLYSYPIAMAIVYLLYDMRYSNTTKEKPCKDLAKILSIIKIALPLAFGSLIVSLGSSAPRLLIKFLINTESVALYTILAYFTSIAAIPLTSLTQVLIPKLSQENNSSPEKAKTITKKLTCATVIYGVTFTIFTCLFAGWAIQTIYKVTYNYHFMDYLAVGIGGAFQFLTVLGNAILFSKREFKSFLTTSCFSMLLVILITPISIYSLGLNGAFLGQMISSIATTALTWKYIMIQRR